MQGKFLWKCFESLKISETDSQVTYSQLGNPVIIIKIYISMTYINSSSKENFCENVLQVKISETDSQVTYSQLGNPDIIKI